MLYKIPGSDWPLRKPYDVVIGVVENRIILQGNTKLLSLNQLTRPDRLFLFIFICSDPWHPKALGNNSCFVFSPGLCIDKIHQVRVLRHSTVMSNSWQDSHWQGVFPVAHIRDILHFICDTLHPFRLCPSLSQHTSFPNLDINNFHLNPLLQMEVRWKTPSNEEGEKSIYRQHIFSKIINI